MQLNFTLWTRVKLSWPDWNLKTRISESSPTLVFRERSESRVECCVNGMAANGPPQRRCRRWRGDRRGRRLRIRSISALACSAIRPPSRLHPLPWIGPRCACPRYRRSCRSVALLVGLVRSLLDFRHRKILQCRIVFGERLFLEMNPSFGIIFNRETWYDNQRTNRHKHQVVVLVN